MPYDARGIANLILQIAAKNNLSLTHLSLQKILYFVHAWYLVKYDKPLIGQPFEAWKFGPVVRVVFDQLKGSRSAIDPSFRLEKLNLETGLFQPAEVRLSHDELELLENSVRYYGEFHAGKLVDLTHENNGPWDVVWRKAEDNAVLGMVISNSSIKSWFGKSGGVILWEGGRRIVN